jgi:hypothetical protein
MHGHEHVESVAPVAQHDERERWLTKKLAAERADFGPILHQRRTRKPCR